MYVNQYDWLDCLTATISGFMISFLLVLQLQVKMHDVQMQLQELKTRLDTERAEVFTEDERALVERVETLKQEFRDLLIELRRRRAADILSDDVSVGVCVYIVLSEVDSVLILTKKKKKSNKL